MELPNDVFDIIINMSCNKTKRILSMTSKYFRDNIKLEINYGRKNVEYLKSYLTSGSLLNKNNLLLCGINNNIKIIINDKNTKVTFFKTIDRSDVPRSIGFYELNSTEFSLSKIIHKRQHKFVSDILMNLCHISLIYRIYYNDLSSTKWLDFIKKYDNE